MPKTALTKTDTKKLLRRTCMDEHSLDNLVSRLHPIHAKIGAEPFKSVAGFIRRTHKPEEGRWIHNVRQKRDLREQIRYDTPKQITKTLKKTDPELIRKIYDISANLEGLDYYHVLQSFIGVIDSSHNLVAKLVKTQDLATIHNVFDLYLGINKGYLIEEFIGQTPGLLEIGGYDLLARVKENVDKVIRARSIYGIEEPIIDISVEAISRVGIENYEAIIEKVKPIRRKEQKINDSAYRFTRHLIREASDIVKYGGIKLFTTLGERGLEVVRTLGPTVGEIWTYEALAIVKRGGLDLLDEYTRKVRATVKKSGRQIGASLMATINKLSKIKAKDKDLVSIITEKVHEAMEGSRHREAAELLANTPRYINNLLKFGNTDFVLQVYDLAIETVSNSDRKAPMVFLDNCERITTKLGYEGLALVTKLVTKQRNNLLEREHFTRRKLAHFLEMNEENVSKLLELGDQTFVMGVYKELINLNGQASADMIPAMFDIMETAGFDLETKPETEGIENIIKRTSELYEICGTNQVSGRIVARKITEWDKCENIEEFLVKTATLETYVQEYVEFIQKERQRVIDTSFKEEKIQETLEFYEQYLGKTLQQFSRDYSATGSDLQKLTNIKEAYKDKFEPERLKSIINYISKQRSRDLIRTLDPGWRWVPNEVKFAISRLDKNTGKKDTVKVLVAVKQTHDFLVDIGRDATEVLSENLHTLSDQCSAHEIIEATKKTRKEYRTNVIGDAEVPEKIGTMVDKAISGYYSLGSNSSRKDKNADLQPMLQLILSSYVREGSEKTFEKIRNLEPNVQVREALEQQGINIEIFERGIRKGYSVSTDGKELERAESKAKSELAIVYDRFKRLEIEESELNSLRELDLRNQIIGLELLVKKHEFDDKTILLKQEIQLHIDNAKSVKGSVKPQSADVEFYVSQDPLEALHMGEFFNTCLRFKGCNAWANIVQVIDSNKNVIYAKTSDGRYIGRNRTVLTDQGVVCTAFHTRTSMSLSDPWIDYLTDFSQELDQDILIPKWFARSITKEGLDLESKTAYVAPAVFNRFYGDGGFTTKNEKDGRVKIEGQFYIIRA